jgi:hypothetical protein
MKRVKSAAIASLFVVALGVLAASTVLAAKKPPPPPPPPPPKGECLCPDVFDPVICSDGNTYSNFCQAGCAGATGCTRTGDI